MTEIHRDLLAVVESVEIESPSRYSVLGVTREVPAAPPGAHGTADEDEHLVRAITADIYDRLYIRPSARHVIRADVLAHRDFVAALSAANTGRGSWRPGWAVRLIDDDGRVVVARSKPAFWASPGEVQPVGGELAPGARCRVWLAKEWRGLLPGFYLAIGDTPDGDEDTDRLGRIYWHLTHDGAVPFLASVTSLLNAANIAFRAKVLDDPNAYHRADAGVIYFRRSEDSRIAPLIARIHSAVCAHLRPDVPLFSRPLCNGVGLADSPGADASFGEHRCLLVARALWEAFAQGRHSESERRDYVAAAFRREGLDPLRPHLGTDSEDQVLIESFGANALEPAFRENKPSAIKPDRAPEPASSVALLEAAIAIGRTLTRGAYWSADGQRCNWIGRTTTELSYADGSITPTAAALGPDVFTGTAGIALFLSQLGAITGDGEFARTAVGAVSHSLRQFERRAAEPPFSPLSFFAGELGAAYTARKVAAQTGDPACSALCDLMIMRVIEARERPHMLDVIGGSAGAIPVLLSMGRAHDRDALGELAISLGEELCGHDPNRAGIFGSGWQHSHAPAIVDVTPSGLSHGASGIGLALLELYAASGHRRFLESARRAFEYEDTLFDDQERNWAVRRRESGSARFERFWCNGAPGIALARLRAATLDSERADEHLQWARLAIATTVEAVDEGVVSPRCDTSLCHGLAGLGEILLIAGELLHEQSYHDRAAALARVLIDRHGSTGDWPSGVISGGPNPSLMLGLAGVGYWLLRLHDPTRVPPFLLFVP